MIPIHELLNRIRWDEAFGDARFAVGYWDRVRREIVVVPLARSALEHRDHYFVELAGTDGEAHGVPLHRIRTVFRNGRLIWQRPGHDAPEAGA